MRIDAVSSERMQPARSPATRPAATRLSAPTPGSSSEPSPSGTPVNSPPGSGHEVSISFADDKTVYRFVDASSGKVVQQIPPAELLRVMHNIGEWLQQAKKRVDFKS